MGMWIRLDVAFEGKEFIEALKLWNVTMHLTKLAHHWWYTLHAQNQAP